MEMMKTLKKQNSKLLKETAIGSYIFPWGEEEIIHQQYDDTNRIVIENEMMIIENCPSLEDFLNDEDVQLILFKSLKYFEEKYSEHTMMMLDYDCEEIKKYKF